MFSFRFVGWQFVELNEIRNAYKIVNKVFYCLNSPRASDSVSTFSFMFLSLVFLCATATAVSQIAKYIYICINTFAK